MFSLLLGMQWITYKSLSGMKICYTEKDYMAEIEWEYKFKEKRNAVKFFIIQIELIYFIFFKDDRY